jgi:hypothetical protein
MSNTDLTSQRTDDGAGIAPTTTVTTSMSANNQNAILSLFALLTPPASLVSSFADLPSSLVSALEAVVSGGPSGLPAYMGALEAGVSMGVNGPMPISELAWFTSQLDQAQSIVPELVALGANSYFSVQGVNSMLSASLSALSAVESTLSTHIFTSVTTAVSTTIGTAVVTATDKVLYPLDQKGKLSTGEKIALGIGIPAFVIGLLLVGFIVFHVRRNRFRSQKSAAMFDRQRSMREAELERQQRRLTPRSEPAPNLPNYRERLEAAIEGEELGPQSLGGVNHRPQRTHSTGAIQYFEQQQSSVSTRRAVSNGGTPSRMDPIDMLAMHYGQTAYDMEIIRQEKALAAAQANAIEMPATPIPTPIPGQERNDEEFFSDGSEKSDVEYTTTIPEEKSTNSIRPSTPYPNDDGTHDTDESLYSDAEGGHPKEVSPEKIGVVDGHHSREIGVAGGRHSWDIEVTDGDQSEEIGVAH